MYALTESLEDLDQFEAVARACSEVHDDPDGTDDHRSGDAADDCESDDGDALVHALRFTFFVAAMAADSSGPK